MAYEDRDSDAPAETLIALMRGYLPTPEQIAATCARIRATWGLGEEQKRLRWSIPPPVEVSEVCGVEPVE